MKSKDNTSQLELFPNNIFDEKILKDAPSKINQWIQAFNNIKSKIHGPINEKDLLDIRKYLKNEFQINYGEADTLDFSDIEIDETNPYQEIGYSQDVRKFTSIWPYYIFLTSKRKNGPCLVFTKKNVNQEIEIFYCDKIILNDADELDKTFKGYAIVSDKPEKFLQYFYSKL